MDYRLVRIIRAAAFAATATAATLSATGAAKAEVTAKLKTTMSTMSVRGAPDPLAPASSTRPAHRSPATARVEKMPDLRWDHIAGSDRWTRAAMRALDAHGDRLLETVPRDIAEWCPAYPEADEWERKAFWVGLLSTLSKHESTWRPGAVGGGGLWYGLVQILPATARGYGCEAKSGAALKDGALNMSCAVRIMNLTVPRDGVVSRGMKGVAADWGPFHSARKREDMRNWLSRQSFCNGLRASKRPVERPEWLGQPAGDVDVVPLFVAWELGKAILRPVPAIQAFDG